MILDRFTILRVLFPAKEAAGEVARRWYRAHRDCPELAGDLIRLGGVLAQHPARMEAGLRMPDPIDPVRMAYEAGRRDMAVAVLALMKITIPELNSLLEGEHETN
jgi:hypothetical protein